MAFFTSRIICLHIALAMTVDERMVFIMPKVYQRSCYIFSSSGDIDCGHEFFCYFQVVIDDFDDYD